MKMSNEEYEEMWNKIQTGKTRFTRADQLYLNFKIGENVRDLLDRVKELEALVKKEEV